MSGRRNVNVVLRVSGRTHEKDKEQQRPPELASDHELAGSPSPLEMSRPGRANVRLGLDTFRCGLGDGWNKSGASPPCEEVAASTALGPISSIRLRPSAAGGSI